ncbi:MAG: thiamine pyrophosphate-dependent enzyme [Kofleriaceae bacterium]
MSIAKSRGEIVDENFRAAVGALSRPGSPPVLGLDRESALGLARSQFLSRHLDLVARDMRRDNQGYYTIGSSGHEGNAAIAHAARTTDPAFLHYRSGAFFLERARRAGYTYAVRDVLLGMCAARTEPIAGGRHKVWGSVELAIPPQTSTIASHLPKALGMAIAIEKRRALHLAIGPAVPDDAVVLCSFGDASLHHSTAQGSINSAAYLAFQGKPAPIVFVCEDNGIGISVPTAPGWVAASMKPRTDIAYFVADGRDMDRTVAVAREAIEHARSTRRPVFLHVETVRLLGHAGADVELSYHSEAKIRADEARDPLLVTARLLVHAGYATPAEVRDLYESARVEVVARKADALAAEPLRDADDVMAPLRYPTSVGAASQPAAPIEVPAEPITLAQQLNHALVELCTDVPEVILFGEDLARKGGVYGVTRRLRGQFGDERIFDTHLDETYILGLAQGAGHLGFVAIPEIEYLAFLHNAADQIRGEAATLPFFSQRQFASAFVLRLPSFGYQKGFGGHFHNDNSVAALLDIPGLVVAAPSRGDDAAAMLRTCADHTRVHQRTCIFLEPIALYHTKDLHPGDGAWASRLAPRERVELGRARLCSDAGAGGLLLVSFANGVPMSLRVAARLAERGIAASVLDLRWLAPLPIADLVNASERHTAVLVVDETRETGGVGEHVLARLLAAGYRGRLARVAGKDSFIPLGPAANHVLLSEDDIERAAVALTSS